MRKYHLHSFVVKNKYVKQNIAVELEYLANRTNDNVNQVDKEDFHNFLRSSVNIISSNIFNSKDDPFSKLHNLRNNDDIVLLSGDTLTVIMDKTDYIQKTENLLNHGIQDGKYVGSEDNTLKDLRNFQTFLYRNFKNQQKSEDYDKMYLSSHQPGRFFATAKTHHFLSNEDINLNDLKLRPIIDQSGTCQYKTSQLISKYLQPLTKNEFSINDTQSFPDMLKALPTNNDEEDISYDVISLFTSIPVDKTIDYICEQIYEHTILKPL